MIPASDIKILANNQIKRDEYLEYNQKLFLNNKESSQKLLKGVDSPRFNESLHIACDGISENVMGQGLKQDFVNTPLQLEIHRARKPDATFISEAARKVEYAKIQRKELLSKYKLPEIIPEELLSEVLRTFKGISKNNPTLKDIESKSKVIQSNGFGVDYITNVLASLKKGFNSL